MLLGADGELFAEVCGRESGFEGVVALLVAEGGQGREGCGGVGGPGPGAEAAEFAAFELGEGGEFGEFEPGVEELGEVLLAGWLFDEDDVVGVGIGEEKEFEVLLEVAFGFGGLEGGVAEGSGEVRFAVGVEVMNDGGAAAGALEDCELLDEVVVEPGFEAAFAIEGDAAFGTDGGEWEGEGAVPGVPVGFFLVFESAQPFEAVADVGDFVFVDFCEECGGVLVAGLVEGLGVVFGVVEVGLFEGEGEAGDVFEG